MIAFSCPHCGNQFEVDDTYAGRDGWCRRCKRMVSVPAASGLLPHDPSSQGESERLLEAFEYAARKADRYEALVARIKRDHEDTTAALRAAKDQVAALEDRLAFVESNVAKPKSAEDGFGQDIPRALEGRIASAEAMLEHATAAGEAKDKRIEALHEDLERERAARESFEAALESVREAVARLDERSAETANQVKALTELAESLRPLESQGSARQDEVERIESLVAEQRNQLEAERVARDELIGPLRDRLADVERRLEELAADAAPIEDESLNAVGPRFENRFSATAEPSDAVVLSEVIEDDAQGSQESLLGSFLRFIDPTERGPGPGAS